MSLSMLRKRAGVTQKDLAKLLGVKQATISCYETGVSKPRLKMLPKLSAALGVSMSAIIECFNYK